MQGIVRSDYIWLDGTRFPVANGGKVIRHRLFSDGAFRVQRDSNQPQFGELNPFVFPYEMADFSKGFGSYVDHSPKFQGKVWASLLDHSIEGVVRLAPYAENIDTATPSISIVYKTILFQGTVYACTDVGLYTVNLSTKAMAAVTSTPVDTALDACIHKGNLWVAWGATTTVRYWSGSAWTTPANTVNANRLVDLDTRLFASLMYSAANEGIQVKHTGDEGATAWSATIFYSDGSTQAAVPSPAATDCQRFIAAPQDIGSWGLYLSTNSGVWEIDYTTGSYRLLLEMGNSSAYNGRCLVYWPSTGKLYCNQKNTVIAIDLATRQSESVGPEYAGFQAGITPGFPSNAGAGTLGNSLYDFTSLGISAGGCDANYLYVGTTVSGSGLSETDRAVVAKLTPDQRWSFESPFIQANTSSLEFYSIHGLTTVEATGNTESGGTDGLAPRLLVAGQSGGHHLWQVVRRGDTFTSFSGGSNLVMPQFLETPWLTFGLPNVNKRVYNLHVDMKTIPANWQVFFYYKVDYADTSAGTLFATLDSSTTFPTLVNVSSTDGLSFRALKLIVRFNRTAVSANSNTPELISMVATFRPAPPARYAYTFDLLVDPELDREGRYTDLQALLDTALEGASTIEFKPSADEAETTLYVTPVGLSTGTEDAEAALVDETQGRDLHPRIRVRLAQVLTS